MMNHKLSFALLLIALIELMSCSSKSQSKFTGMQENIKDGNVLIVYLSRTSNTRTVAEIIHEEVGGSLVELELVTPYPKNYDSIVAQVVRGDETGYRPPLKTKIDSIEKYDVVFVGFPTWNMQLPPPIKSFLSAYDLSRKTVVPFNTNGGYGLGSSIRQIEDLCPESNLLEAFSTKGGLERDGIYLSIKGERKEEVRAEVRTWLRKINQ